MEILQILLLVGLFVLMALLMFFRVIPALIALPLMAVQTSLIGGVSLQDTIELVIGQGSLKLHGAYTVTMFGCMLSVLLQKTGVAESFIKKGAELSGDNPWVSAVLMLALITLLFTTLTGLGAIIMVATIVMPIMASVGIGPMTTVGIFLFGLSIGGTLNVGNWAVYVHVMGLTIEQIRPFGLVMFSLTSLVALVYITVQLYQDGHDLDVARVLAWGLLVLVFFSIVLATYQLSISGTARLRVWSLLTLAAYALGQVTAVALALAFAAAVWRAASGASARSTEVHWLAYLAPVIPLLLILVFKVHFIAAFLIGLLHAFAATYRPRRLNLFIQSIFEGGAIAMPAVVLMFGIGMLLVAVMGPGGKLEAYPQGWPVLELLRPLMKSLVPSGPVSYILSFTLAAPLALYRGPLNVWGMGYGLAAVFLASGMSPTAVMGLLMAVGQVQGISDPTNTHNIWLASEVRVDVQKVLWNTLPYTWAVAFLGLAASAAMFLR
ncbi:MAG: citrate transporter [Candidatus Riflebacteria bacterium]|nr:citrate transporter [Candidatus Riflebacteria bacterium]